MNIDYTQSGTPDEYRCAHCQKTGIKLWRQYQTVAPQLLCVNCVSVDQDKNIADIDADGRYTSDMGRTDQIGWYVPAVPDEEGGGYWGYTSVPDAGVEWWRRLPTF